MSFICLVLIYIIFAVSQIYYSHTQWSMCALNFQKEIMWCILFDLILPFVLYQHTGSFSLSQFAFCSHSNKHSYFTGGIFCVINS